MSAFRPSRPLDAIELRVLGCLLEKELSTPDGYPLSLTSLTVFMALARAFSAPWLITLVM